MNKKIILLILLFLIPNKIIAKTFYLKDTDLKIDLKENINWLIFIPDNLKENKDLDKVKIKYKYIKSFLDRNDVYMVAVNNDIKMIVSKEETYNMDNLSKIKPKEVHKYAAKLTNDEYTIYTNDYKYILLNYKKEPYDVMAFHTIINSNEYIIKFKKRSKITDDEKTEIYNIINNVSYEIKNEYKYTLW